MSDETKVHDVEADPWVEIAGGHDSDNAILLLDAADGEGYDQRVVQTTSVGFRVPKSVAEAAGLEPEQDALEAEVEREKSKAAEANADADDEDPLDFSSRTAAEEYAAEQDPPIEIEGKSGMSADEYKKAVRDAALAREQGE